MIIDLAICLNGNGGRDPTVRCKTAGRTGEEQLSWLLLWTLRNSTALQPQTAHPSYHASFILAMQKIFMGARHKCEPSRRPPTPLGLLSPLVFFPSPATAARDEEDAGKARPRPDWTFRGRPAIASPVPPRLGPLAQCEADYFKFVAHPFLAVENSPSNHLIPMAPEKCPSRRLTHYRLEALFESDNAFAL